MNWHRTCFDVCRQRTLATMRWFLSPRASVDFWHTDAGYCIDRVTADDY